MYMCLSLNVLVFIDITHMCNNTLTYTSAHAKCDCEITWSEEFQQDHGSASTGSHGVVDIKDQSDAEISEDTLAVIQPPSTIIDH